MNGNITIAIKLFLILFFSLGAYLSNGQSLIGPPQLSGRTFQKDLSNIRAKNKAERKERRKEKKLSRKEDKEQRKANRKQKIKEGVNAKKKEKLLEAKNAGNAKKKAIESKAIEAGEETISEIVPEKPEEIERWKDLKRKGEEGFKKLEEIGNKEELKNIAARDVALNQNISDKLENELEKHAALEGIPNDNPLDFLKSQSLVQNEIPDLKSNLSGFQMQKMKQMRQHMIKQFASLTPDQITRQQEQLQLAKDQISKLKKKYKSVPSSSDLSTATKHSSLKEKPIKKRLVFGGNLQMYLGNPMSINTDPYLGFQVNKKWTVNIGGTYRNGLNLPEKIMPKKRSAIPLRAVGIQGFSDYTTFRNFFIRGSYEQTRVPDPNAISERREFAWTTNILGGIGRTQSISKKLKLKTIILYNFTHQPNGPYGRPWVFKMGVEYNRQ